MQPDFASLAVAGPVTDQVCVMTNCPWVIDGPALTEQFHIPYVECCVYMIVLSMRHIMQNNLLIPTQYCSAQ